VLRHGPGGIHFWLSALLLLIDENTGDRNLPINARTSAKVSGPLIVDLLKKAVHCL
jgi:hypothetical protein